MRISRTQLRSIVQEAIKENLSCHEELDEGADETWTDNKGRKFGDCSEPGCASSDTDFEEDKVKGGSSKKWCETHMNPKNRGKKKTVKEGVSSIQKDLFPGSGKLAKFAEDVDKLLMDTSKEAKELVEEIEEDMKTNLLAVQGGGATGPQVGERNRALQNRVSILKRLSSNCVAMLELLRRES